MIQALGLFLGVFLVFMFSYFIARFIELVFHMDLSLNQDHSKIINTDQDE